MLFHIYMLIISDCNGEQEVWLMQTDHAYSIHVTKIFGQGRRHGRTVKISSHLV